jgi:hypothetical protein
MTENNYYDEFDLEHYDIDTIISGIEVSACEIIDFLMHDIERLGSLVMETREQVNNLSVELGHKYLPYPMTAEDVFDCSYYDNPVMRRYIEFYCPNGEPPF